MWTSSATYSFLAQIILYADLLPVNLKQANPEPLIISGEIFVSFKDDNFTSVNDVNMTVLQDFKDTEDGWLLILFFVAFCNWICPDFKQKDHN